MKILKYIFCILLFICLFIWAGCNIDISSWMERQEIQYRMNNYRDVIIVDKHFDWDLSRAAKKKKIEMIIDKQTKQENE